MNTSAEFLKSEFNKRKGKNPHFSLRSFARWLEISPAQVSQIMSGKRPLTLKALEKINKKLDLSPFEKQSLVDTVVRISGQIDATNPVTTFQSLSEDQFKVISDWYHIGILGLTRLPNAKPDPRWIARKLSISTEEANQALQRLVRLGVLTLNPKFKQIGDPLKVISDIPSAAIRRYHKQNLALAGEKIETVENAKRDFQSLSIPINSKDVPKLKEHIDRFLDQVQKFSDKSKPDQIYNLNLQLFPITQLKELP